MKNLLISLILITSLIACNRKTSITKNLENTHIIENECTERLDSLSKILKPAIANLDGVFTVYCFTIDLEEYKDEKEDFWLREMTHKQQEDYWCYKALSKYILQLEEEESCKDLNFRKRLIEKLGTPYNNTYNTTFDEFTTRYIVDLGYNCPNCENDILGELLGGCVLFAFKTTPEGILKRISNSSW